MSVIFEKEIKKYDYILKIIVVGDPHVGKSNILSRFSDGYFNDTIVSTIAIDFRIRSMMVDNYFVKVQLWDTAGQEKYKSLISSYYNGADGVIFVYDVTNEKSLESIPMWMSDVLNKNDRAALILVGNKIDKYTDEYKFILDKAYEIVKSNNIKFIPTSAKSGENIDNLFCTIVSDIIYKKNSKIETKKYMVDTVVLEIDKDKNKSKCC